MNRIAAEFGGFTVTWFGIFVAAGFLTGILTAARRAPRAGIAPDAVFDAAFWLFVGAIVGARLLYVISYWKEGFANRPFTEIFMIQRGGIVYYGGLIGAALACILFAAVKRQPLWKLADVFAPSVALGYALGRWGCLMNGCCYGRPCALPWAIRFPADHETGGHPVHPTQIYESAMNFILYFLLVRCFRRRTFDGQVFSLYLIGYAVLRSVIELFRGDYPVYHWGYLTPAHGASLVILIVGVGMYWVRQRRPADARPG